MPIDGKVKQLYDALKLDGADVGTEQEFNDWFLARGEQGYKNRKEVWQAFKDDGADVGENYEEFRNWLGLRPAGPDKEGGRIGIDEYDVNDFQQTIDKANQPAPKPRATSPAPATETLQEQAKPSQYISRAPAVRHAGDPGASRFGAPFMTDTQMTAAERDQVYRDNDFAVRQLNRMRQEEQRRTQPLVDTGDAGANRNIVKTQGEWENDLQKGVKRISSSVMPAFDKVIAAFDKRADERSRAMQGGVRPYVPGSVDASALFATKAANEERDPEKILDYLKHQMEGVYNDGAFIEEIGKEADKMGIDRAEYLEKVVKPQIDSDLGAQLRDKLIKREMPKSTADYILSGVSNSIVGMLANAVTETKGQRDVKNEAEAMTEEGRNPYYKPGTGAELTKMGVTFAADAPFFGLYGRVGGKVAKKVAESQIQNMMAKGLSEGAARSIVGAALENSVGARMKNYIMQHVVSGGITMGGFNATSESARQVRDSEFDPLKVAGSTAEGLATGAAFGLTGGVSQALSQPLSGFAKIGAKAAGFGAEAETLYTTEELSKMIRGDEGFTNPFEGSVEALMKLGVMKLSSPGGPTKAVETFTNPLKSAKAEHTGVNFTKEEEAYVRNTAEGRSLLDALSNMHPDKAISEVNGKKKLTADGEKMRRQLADSYNAFMENPEYPSTVKQKVAHVLGGVYNPGLETGADIIQNEDGSVVLKTRDKDGNCIREMKFDSFKDADQWRGQFRTQMERNDAVNMWNNASDEARQKIVDSVRQQISGEKEAAAMLERASGMNQRRMVRELDKLNKFKEEHEGRELTEEEALNYIQAVIKDGSDEVFRDMYKTIHDNVYPADEYNPRQRYEDGRKTDPMERHYAQVDAQLAEERLELLGQDFADEVKASVEYADEKMAELAMRNGVGREQIEAARDYYNAMARLSGMMDETLKGVDEQVEAANAQIRRNTHPDSGALIEAAGDRKNYYVTAGHIQVTPDGRIVSTDGSGMVILRDRDTGEIEVRNPQSITVTAISDPNRLIESNESMDGLRGRLMKQADDSIEFAPGTPAEPISEDSFIGADGQRYISMQMPDEQGNPVWMKVAVDENYVPFGKPEPLDIDEYRKAKSDEIDAANRPGTAEAPGEQSMLVPEQEELEADNPAAKPQGTVEGGIETAGNGTETAGNGNIEGGNNAGGEAGAEGTGAHNPPATALRIPVDEKGRQLFEQAKPEDTLSDLTEKYGEEKARRMISQMAASTARAYDELSRKDTTGITDMADLVAHEDALSEAKRKADYWNDLLGRPKTSEENIITEGTDGEVAASAGLDVKTITGERGTGNIDAPVPPEAGEHEETPEAPSQNSQPTGPTAEQKIAQGTVKNNIGKRLGFQNQDGTRSEVVIGAFKGDDMVEVTRQDYDAQGNAKGEPYSQDLRLVDVGNSIVSGYMKPVLSTEEKLRHAYNGKVGMQNIIDVLTDKEREQMLRAYEQGDQEALRDMTNDLVETHREDLILNDREKRNANVSRIMQGSGSREDKLRRIRKEFQGFDMASEMLSDEALQPSSIEDYVADLHSRVPKSGEGQLAYFSYDVDGKKVVGMQDETGHGTKSGGDTRGYAPWLAPRGKGMSLQEYAETIHSQLPEGIKERYSDQDVRNAILEVFGGAERPSDIPLMVIRRGVLQAEQAARRMEEQWIDGGVSYQKVSADDKSFSGRLERAKQQTNTEPTEGQKEAGNYKKGHVSFGGYDFVVENPEGSMRRGRDADGKEWEQKMNNTYGYILGKYGKDGDHLDMFINDAKDLDNWNGTVYVVDQVDPKTGKFDEHKILYGYDSEAEAREAYLSNYEKGWKGLGKITGVDKETFDKWLDSSDRKIKAFAEHSIIRDAAKPVEAEPQAAVTTPAEREKVLMDAVVEKMNEAGIDVSTDWEEGQKVLDEFNGSHELKPMGSRVDSKKSQLASEFEGKELTPEQQAVADVYTGKRDNIGITFTRDGQEHTVTMRQGNENKAGTKHSLYRHYGTGVGVITADDVMRIPDVLSNGEREEKKRGNVRLAQYRLTDKNGKRYTVITEIKKAGEVFNDFYTNKKASSQTPQMPNGDTPESARTKDLNASSGAKVQQNPETTKESDEKLKQFKTADGHAYGFTYKGKIYIDPRIATSETPIHEYGHLWAEMKRQTAPEEWDAIKNVLLNDKLVKPIIDRVKKDYPELAKEGREDDFIEEILTQFSGKRGAERLREIAKQIAAEKGGVFGKAEAVTAMQRLKNILNQFWAGVARMMGWKYRNANQVADRIMADMLDGVNPREMMKEAASDKMSEMRTYHGSSADFDQFDHTKVGSGEGQAVSGYGTYVTTSEGTARYYANVSSERHKKVLQHEGWTLNGEVVRDSSVKRAYDFLKENDGDVDKAIAACEAKIEARKKRSDAFSRLFKDNSYMENALNYLHQEKEKPGTLGYQEQIEEKPDRQLYEVEIPDDTGENYFDLDGKPSKSQKADIRKRFLSALDKTEEADYWRKNRDIIDDEWKQVNSKEATGDTARGVMEQFLPQDEVSKIFSDMGYVGHKVNGSDGTTYVVFNESDLKIMDRMKFQRVRNPEPFKLSDSKKDAEGNSFYERKGSVDLWSASSLFAKAGRQDAPIRLTDRNASHIMESHGNVFKSEQDVFDFLDGVFGNATKLRRGRGRGMFVVVENDKTDQAAIIKLMPSETGDYYNVETAGYYRKSKWKDSEEVIADLSEPGRSDAAADASKPQVPDENGGELINAEAQTSSSGGIDTKKSDTLQENWEENAENFREGEAVAVPLGGMRKLTPKQRRARQTFAERQWRRAHDDADETVKKLNLSDNVTIVDSIDELDGHEKFTDRKKRAKGWYDPETGKIVVVMDNHRSPADVVKTILHEGVSHHGLRKLFGEHFDTFLDNVYNSAESSIRDEIDVLAKKNGGDVRKGTEEYLARLAEDTDFEDAEKKSWARHWFNQIKQAFVNMLKEIGLPGYDKYLVELTDNELRYILWRSYKNLSEPGRYRNVFRAAEETAMRNKLAKEVKMPVKGRVEDEIPLMVMNHQDEKAIRQKVSDMSLEEATEAYRRIDDSMRDEKGLDLDEQFEANKMAYMKKNGLNGLGKFVADDLQKAMDKYGSGMVELRWALQDRIEELGGSYAREDNELYRDDEEESPKFQRAGFPEPEMTPEERQYWKKWDADMKKWKERNALPAEATGPGEKPTYQAGEDAMAYATRMAKYIRERNIWQTAPKLEDYRQKRTDKDVLEAAREEERQLPDSPQARMRRIAAEFQQIRHAMSQQKAYDKATVKAVTDFAQDFMKQGFGDNLSRGEMERMLSSVKNATGAKDIRKEVDNIMNILIDNHLRNLDHQVEKLSSTKELSKTAQGVEKQGKLELKGQRMIQAFRKAREGRMDAERIREEIGSVAEKMARNDEEAPMWEQEYEGLSLALQYQENVEASRDEYAELDREYKDAVKEYKSSGRSYKEQQQLLESLEQAMMENKIERIGMFGNIIGRLEGNISESMQGAREFVEREKERVKHIQQIANFDLAGKPADSLRENQKGKPANFFLQPLGTFEQMLRQFGSRNANGEGYLYDYFMRNWMDSTDKAYVNEQKAKEELDAKAREVFGNKVKRWSDLYDISRKLPTMEVDVLDGENRRTFTLTQGNLLYIYMADKMNDGRMKLRKMGIDEEAVEKIKDFLDPRLVQLGDWLQEEYLPQKRTEYNKVHERMFGAPMAAIDHYFPLKVLSDARYQEQDVNVPDSETLPSTITGNIIKRRKNVLPLDILHTDALSLAIEHVEDMERWAAQAEWNKDVNTLLSYTTFRNKVKNMKTVYGSGDALWNSFKDAAKMAAGTYDSSAKSGHVDKTISNIAKGVTAAKINFRVYTALKQLLSAPAFLHDVRMDDFVKNGVNPYGSWKWAMENMPVFRKRWKSRQMGDTRLMDDPTDWKMWKTNVVQMATRMGMSPNALVDGVTCAVGARSIYESRYRKYKKIGASDEVARKRALQDAEIGYNLTQQSSEGAFVSAIQKDRTVAANMLSVFRNASMAYTRQWYNAYRNLKKHAQKGYKEDSIDFMARQMQEQLGLDDAQAKKAAELEYKREIRRDFAALLNMMFGVTVAWNLGASLPYLLVGDDDKTKEEMLTDALLKGMAGPTEGYAAGNMISDIVGRMTSEQTRNAIKNEGWGAGLDAAIDQVGDYEINPLPLMADLQSMIKKMGYDKYAAAQDVFNIVMQSAVGVNPQTFTDMWNAFLDYGNPEWVPFTDSSVGNNDLGNSKEIALFIMRVLNAPTSSWLNKYIDELGMNAEDAKKLPYDEMARRYANYKHWKDAPMMGWLRSDEARQEKMGKIREKFDKAVEERMNRLDYEYLREDLDNSEDETEKKAIVSAMKEQVKALTDKQLLEQQSKSDSQEERKMLMSVVKERAKEGVGKLSDDALRDSTDSAKSMERKNAFIGEYAKRQGTQDYYGRKDANETYKELRTFEDAKEDIMLSDLYSKEKSSLDKKTLKKVNKLKGKVSAQRSALGNSSDQEADMEKMKDLRKWRREALEILLRAEADSK